MTDKNCSNFFWDFFRDTWSIILSILTFDSSKTFCHLFSLWFFFKDLWSCQFNTDSLRQDLYAFIWSCIRIFNPMGSQRLEQRLNGFTFSNSLRTPPCFQRKINQTDKTGCEHWDSNFVFPLQILSYSCFIALP